MNYIGLVLTLPTQNATVRVRAWRALKAAGAGVLREGFYVLPESAPTGRETLLAIRDDVLANGGTALLLSFAESEELDPATLFDRSEDYRNLCEEIAMCRDTLSAAPSASLDKALRKLHKSFEQIVSIDFFADEAQRQARQMLEELAAAIARATSPDEPAPQASAILRRNAADYRGRVWATRARPWVDRLACAWLIRRFIDPDARLLWLASPADCPRDALGFDFDGASFTHTESLVSFEVLLQSFGVQTEGLPQIARIVHYLDVGGIEPPDASGIERVLAGLRTLYEDDDDLAAVTGTVFDGLLKTYQQGDKK